MIDVGIEMPVEVYAKAGPTWDYDLNVLCETYGEYACEFYSAIDPDQQCMSFKDEAHWQQNTKSQRFQMYVDDWEYPDKYEADLIPLENITEMPISMIIAEFDVACTPEKAYDLAEQLATIQTVKTFIGYDHLIAFDTDSDDYM